MTATDGIMSATQRSATCGIRQAVRRLPAVRCLPAVRGLRAIRGLWAALLFAALFAAVPGGQAKGQTFELSAGWTLPFGELSDLSDGGPSVRGAFLYPLSWGHLMAWSGYTDHRGMTFEVPPGVEGFAAGEIDAQNVPFLAGVRFNSDRVQIDLTAGGLWKRLKLGNLDSAGTSIDPVAAAHVGITVYDGLKVHGGVVIARYDWRYATVGLGWQF